MKATPQPGHMLVIEKGGRLGQVLKMEAVGAWEYLRDDISDGQTEWTHRAEQP
jgi:hypothetical protein